MRKEFEINLKASILAFICVIIGTYAQYIENKVLVDWAYVTMFAAIVVGGACVVIGSVKMKFEEFEAKRSKKKQKA